MFLADNRLGFYHRNSSGTIPCSPALTLLKMSVVKQLLNKVSILESATDGPPGVNWVQAFEALPACSIAHLSWCSEQSCSWLFFPGILGRISFCLLWSKSFFFLFLNGYFLKISRAIVTLITFSRHYFSPVGRTWTSEPQGWHTHAWVRGLALPV